MYRWAKHGLKLSYVLVMCKNHKISYSISPIYELPEPLFFIESYIFFSFDFTTLNLKMIYI